MGAKSTLFIGISIFVILGIIFLALAGIYTLEVYKNRSPSFTAFPQNGTYYCQELDATIFISESQIRFQTRNGILMDVIRLYGGVLSEGMDTNYGLRAEFYWNQDVDCIELKFETYPEKADLRKAYKFVHICNRFS